MLLRMRKLWSLWLLPALCAARLFAQSEGADDATKSKCAKYEQTPLPSEAVSVSAPKRWPNCDSYKLYSGIGTKVDFEAARKCAWSERLAAQAGLEPRYTVGSVFGGSAMLTVLYANGDGVERNIPLAIRFACEAGWAPGEIEGRVKHLEALDGVPKSSDTNFKFCDDITSGFMEGFCESYSREQASQARANALKELSSKWPERQRMALATLRQAQAAYAKAHRGEIDAQGSSRGAQEIRAQESLSDSFLAALQAFERGGLPHHSAAEAGQADAELNHVYARAIDDAEAAKSKYGAVPPESLRTAELVWLKYRDAWVQFAKLHYPSVSTESWLTLLTRDRIATIQGGPCESDPDDSGCERQDTHAARPLP